MTQANLSETLFKPRFKHPETSTLVRRFNHGAQPPVQSALDGKTIPHWYRMINRLMWIWRGIDPREILDVQARIVMSDAERTDDDLYDTVIGYRGGNWIYEWATQAMVWQQKACAEEDPQLSGRHWLHAATLYNFMTKRASGLATYRNTDFFGVIDGLNLTLQYQGKNENRDVKKQNGDGFGTSLTYDFGGSDFAISGAYTNSDRTNEQNLQSRGTGKRAEAWATGLKYDANNIYLATFYSETRKMTPISGGFANKTQNFEAVAQYQFDFGLRPSLGYVLSKGKDIEGIGDEDLVNYIDVGATYYFNKNMSAFVDYKINQLDSDNKLNINNDDIVAVGMTYQF